MDDFYTPITPSPQILEIMDTCFKEELEGDKNARNKAKVRLKEYLYRTVDGTYTLPSMKVNGSSENMHSSHGALEESMEKFIIPADLKKKRTVHILDLCSGLGYNTAAALDHLMDDDIHIQIDMVEYSPQILGASLIIPPPLPSHALVRKVVEAHLISEGFLAMEIEKEYDVDNIHIDVHIGDARKVLGRLNKTFNTVFLDPFSPAKSPELYSLQFFQLLKKLVSDDGMILTYTNAAPVRYALIHAGFNVGAGPMVVGKEGTIASNDADILLKPLSSNDERMIALSDAGTPYRDPELNLEPVIISENRQKERISIRGNNKLASTVRTPLYLYNSIKNERMRRRVKKQLIKIGIEDFNSPGSRFIVCPQFNECICFCGQGRFKNSGDRIKEMERRMEDFVKNPSKYA